MELEKRYDHTEAEERIYKMWEDSGYFNPDKLPGERTETFSMVLPPPNVTGTLHMGHAAMLAIQDILVRYQRMQGKKAVWIPGTDHAAIATQEKVEKLIYKKEKQNRHDLGREVFLERVDAFAKESHDTIVNQVRRMGSSIDWSREAFTLDETRGKAVREAFVRMYNAGLIYRGHRIVNWDPKMQTTVSDDEIERKEEKGNFYYIKYGPFTIGTARPETKFGDKYVVMHPDDDRYKEYEHGQEIEVDWINGKITATIIKDESVDPEFGTGVMTITPWHDATDFEIAERHNLEKTQIINKYGKLLPVAGEEFEGLHIKKARPLLVEKLEKMGLLERVDESYVHNLATNSRGGGVIEPQIMEQWFIDVNKKFEVKNSKIQGIETGSEVTLKELMQHVVRNKNIEIIPERFEKTYFHWIDNLRDWCISRQIWYGHQVPVWYKGEEMHVGTEAPEGDGWEQDPDTLDTWFSSGLWTFSTLGWPEETEDFKAFHPTTILETGYDIIFFWVARMILMTGFLLNDVPFKHVYLHGLVRDKSGKKMSKSLGNIIDPLEMIDKYGAGATRLSLIIGTAPGNDLKLSEDRVRGYRNFATKIWNATRFVLMQGDTPVAYEGEHTKEDAEIIAAFNAMKKEVTEHIEAFRFYLAGDMLYQYFWNTFAAEIIEAKKEALYGDDEAEKERARALLLMLLEDLLKLLHPFMPFVTEELYGKLPGNEGKMLMVASWPQGRE